MNLVNKIAGMLFCLVLPGFLFWSDTWPVIAAEEPPTELYVRTIPEGAKVFLDGKEVGVTPNLFKAEPGTAKIMLKLEGCDPIKREIEIQASRITRLELALNPDAKTGESLNILKNPGFESGDKAPDYWEKGSVPKGTKIDGVKYSWDKKVAFEGKASLCIDKTAQRYFPIAQLSQTVKREGDKPVVLVSAQVKTKNMTKAVLDVLFLDAQDNWISHQWIAYIGAKEEGDPPAVHDWKPYSGKADIPPNTKKICIGLQVYGPGKIWFDDIRASYTDGLRLDVNSALAIQNDPDSKAAEMILRNYAEAVWKELPPKLDKANLANDEASKIAVQTAFEIASQHILPHKDIVDRYLLDRIQKGPPIDSSIWNSASVINIPETAKAGPEWKEGFWDPIVILYSGQNIALMEKLGNEKAVKYLVLGSCAPLPMLLVDDNLDKPEFVTIYPNFLFIYRLERDHKGLYRLSEIRQTSQSGIISYKDLPSDLSPGRKVLWEYSCKAWDELLPKLDSLKTDEIYEAASRIAESELARKRDILKEEAAKALAKLTKAEPFDRAEWHSMLDDIPKQDNLDKAQLALSKYGMLPIRWNPVQLASQIKMTFIAASNKPEAIGKLAMVSAAATQSLDQAIDADPEHPIIAMPTGNEMFIIHLRRNEAGLYDLVDFEWLTK